MRSQTSKNCFLLALLAIGCLASPSTAANSTLFNVQSFGAIGDGQADDTAAIQRAFTAALSVATGATVYFPGGRYLLTSTVQLQNAQQLVVLGDGFPSSLLWASDSHLFRLASSATEVAVRDLRIASVRVAKSGGSFAFYCENLVRSQFERLLLEPEGGANPGGGIAMTGVADTNTMRDVQMWLVQGDGVQVRSASYLWCWMSSGPAVLVVLAACWSHGNWSLQFGCST
jgi:hypothetical protein